MTFVLGFVGAVTKLGELYYSILGLIFKESDFDSLEVGCTSLENQIEMIRHPKFMEQMEM